MQFLIEQSKRKKKTKPEGETYENRLHISFAVRMLNGIFYQCGYDARI